MIFIWFYLLKLPWSKLSDCNNRICDLRITIATEQGRAVKSEFWGNKSTQGREINTFKDKEEKKKKRNEKGGKGEKREEKKFKGKRRKKT